MKSIMETVTTYRSLLGESPLWDAASGTIFWVDILQGEIHALEVLAHRYRSWKTGQLIGAIALGTSGRLVGAGQQGFFYIDRSDGRLDFIAHPEAHLPANRFNDGKCDPAGRFWAGTMSTAGVPGAGSLYALEPRGTVSLKIQGVSVSNGLAWSPDGSLFYYIDTPTRVVVAYDFDADSGAIRNKRVVVRIPEEMGKPDGMTIDEEGMLWIALWGGGTVTRWHPATGKLLHHFSLPVTQVSSCTFGGTHLDDLYVTTARVGLEGRALEAQPLAGSLFVLRNCGFRGLKAARFKGPAPLPD